MRTRRILGLLALIAILGGVGFGAGRFLLDRGGTEAQSPETPRFTPQLERLLEEEKQKPRFTGEILGIYIAPQEGQIPPEYLPAKALCTSGSTELPWEDGKVMDFPRTLVLPPEYEQVEGPSSGVFSCNGVVTHVNRECLFRGVSGLPANIIIGRTINRGEKIDAAAERISVAVIGGRRAIVVKPVTADATAQTAEIIFPEPF
ncbi:MAG TPA: hypothetical protein VNM43_01780, partial [Dehalococcoidia bacterium]|nr:hypothetical protein [Dehalococcoidia bacterium]